MTEHVKTCLSGMKEICDYTQRSEPIIRRWHKELGFPLIKMFGAVQSDKKLIDEWLRKRIEESREASDREGLNSEV